MAPIRKRRLASSCGKDARDKSARATGLRREGVKSFDMARKHRRCPSQIAPHGKHRALTVRKDPSACWVGGIVSECHVLQVPGCVSNTRHVREKSIERSLLVVQYTSVRDPW